VLLPPLDFVYELYRDGYVSESWYPDALFFRRRFFRMYEFPWFCLSGQFAADLTSA